MSTPQSNKATTGDILLSAVRKRYEAKKEEAMAELYNLCSNAAGIGEHTYLVDDVDQKIQQIEKYESLIQTTDMLDLSAPDKSSDQDADTSSGN